MRLCPICGGRIVGRIGRERYYCGECCHEWTEDKESLKVYQILSDGTVACLKNIIENPKLLAKKLKAC